MSDRAFRNPRGYLLPHGVEVLVMGAVAAIATRTGQSPRQVAIGEVQEALATLGVEL